MDVNAIRNGLHDFQEVDVEKYVNYLWAELHAKKSNGTSKNPWMKQRTDVFFVNAFKNVASSGLVIDGIHITVQSTGVSFDYQAYKNKMLLAYPESIIDVDLVYDGDEFSFNKKDGLVHYDHAISNAFHRKDENVIGGYCVVKNKRGEFLTILTRDDIDKHRKVARTDYIWAAWFVEMSRKTLIKKACKQHFEDIFVNMNSVDNENSNVDNPMDIDLDAKAEIEKTGTVEALHEYWEENKDKHTGKWFNMLVSSHKENLISLVTEGEE